MIALAASDYPEAKKQARKAEKLNQILSDLLSAHFIMGLETEKQHQKIFC